MQLTGAMASTKEARPLRYADFIYGDAPELRPLLDHCAHFLATTSSSSTSSSLSFTEGGGGHGGIGGDGGSRRRVEHVEGGGVLGTVSGPGKLEAATLTFRHGQADFGRI